MQARARSAKGTKDPDAPSANTSSASNARGPHSLAQFCDALPLDVMDRILGPRYLEQDDAKVVRLVCTAWNKIVSQQIRSLRLLQQEARGEALMNPPWNAIRNFSQFSSALTVDLVGIANNAPDQRRTRTIRRRTTTILAKMGAIVPSLQRLSLEGLSNSVVSTLAAATALSALSLGKPGGNTIQDNDLRRFTALHQLRQLRISSRRMTDAGFKPLSTLVQLQRLEITYTPLTGVGVRSLCNLTNVQHLSLKSTYINNPALQPLSSLTGLQHLDLSYCGISTLTVFSTLSQLSSLELPHTLVGNGALSPLSALSSLRSLNLASTFLTDSGLSPLSAFTALARLNLNGTHVGNSGMRHLASLTGLQELHVKRTEVITRAFSFEFCGRSDIPCPECLFRLVWRGLVIHT